MGGEIVDDLGSDGGEEGDPILFGLRKGRKGEAVGIYGKGNGVLFLKKESVIAAWIRHFGFEQGRVVL